MQNCVIKSVTVILTSTYFPNGRYIDCLSLTYATIKGKMLKLHSKYKRKETFTVNIIVRMIRSSHKR